MSLHCPCFPPPRAPRKPHYAWVGTYNPNGEGLYRFTVDAKTGAPAR
ncbi:lactonase family protein [Klebsiella pneumoniae subsp. pneumoniae]|nr:lactonase family protein [Klebsiella pneumoniae subsp. pneumoniae]